MNSTITIVTVHLVHKMLFIHLCKVRAVKCDLSFFFFFFFMFFESGWPMPVNDLFFFFTAMMESLVLRLERSCQGDGEESSKSSKFLKFLQLDLVNGE